MDTKERISCVLQLEKLDAERRYADMLVLLCDLDRHRVTTEQLETTEEVKVLYGILKSCKDQAVRKEVKALLAKWKREYAEKRGRSGMSTAGEGELVQEAEDDSKTEQKPSSLSSVRSKCVQLLVSAIGLQPSDQVLASELAENIENHIHHLHPSNPTRYKTCIRSKIGNLKNPKSRHLREGLLTGSLSPQSFARMSAEEMASPDLQRLRREYSSQSVSERQLPRSTEGTPTQKIRCRRCDGTACRVKQVPRGTLFLPAWAKQSGPDDDSMTFVTCDACGQQWYHNNWICL